MAHPLDAPSLHRPRSSGLRKPTLIGLSLLALLATAALAHAQPIYRCLQADGLPLFSRTPCSSAHQLEPVITNGYPPTPLTQQELAQLAALARSQTKTRRSKTKASLGAGPKHSNACHRSQEALDALQARRRKGYKLSEASRLDPQEQRLKQNIRLHC